MIEQLVLADFFSEIESDPRVNSRHISLYASLLQIWTRQGSGVELQVYSWEVMNLCKISASSTYHKTIRELHEYGYIKYSPSFNHFSRSRVSLARSETHAKLKAR